MYCSDGRRAPEQNVCLKYPINPQNIIPAVMACQTVNSHLQALRSSKPSTSSHSIQHISTQGHIQFPHNASRKRQRVAAMLAHFWQGSMLPQSAHPLLHTVLYTISFCGASIMACTTNCRGWCAWPRCLLPCHVCQSNATLFYSTAGGASTHP